MTDVAREAGVSVATVSLVMNDKPDVARETRERVLECAQRMGYRPNLLARATRTRISNLIMILVPTIESPAFPRLVHHIEMRAALARYQVLLCSSRGPDGDRCITSLQDRSIDGCIVIGDSRIGGDVGIESSARAVQALLERGVPFVFVGDEQNMEAFAARMRVASELKDRLLHTIEVDRIKATHAATRHLLRTGHRRIGFAGEAPAGYNEGQVPLERKLDGYRRALLEASVEIDPLLISKEGHDYHAGVLAVEHFLTLPEPPTGVICTGDTVAFGVVRGAIARGLRVPEELSVIGYDDLPAAAFYNPPLSSISVPVSDIAEESFRRLLRLMDGEVVQPNVATFDTQLVIRESTA